jgi:hypothetical protein
MLLVPIGSLSNSFSSHCKTLVNNFDMRISLPTLAMLLATATAIPTSAIEAQAKRDTPSTCGQFWNKKLPNPQKHDIPRDAICVDIVNQGNEQLPSDGSGLVLHIDDSCIMCQFWMYVPPFRH